MGRESDSRLTLIAASSQYITVTSRHVSGDGREGKRKEKKRKEKKRKEKKRKEKKRKEKKRKEKKRKGGRKRWIKGRGGKEVVGTMRAI
jgi:hypothetical protein